MSECTIHIVIFCGMAAIACSAAPSTPPQSTCGAEAITVVATDYQSSGVGTLTLDGNEPRLLFGSQLGGDPALSLSGGRAFFLAREGAGAVFELGPCGNGIAGYSPREPGDPASVNPQAVAALPDGSLLVTRFALASAIVLAPDGSPRTTIDLSSLDGDGNPNMSAADVALVGGATKAVVVLQRLDDTTLYKLAKQTASIALIDAASLAVEAVVDLNVRNPFGRMDKQGDAEFWLAAAGDFGAANEPDAGIVRFDAVTRKSDLVVSETQLGASVSEVAIAPKSPCGAAIVADPSALNRTWVVTFNTKSGEVGGVVLGPTSGYDLRGIAWVRGGTSLLVGDRTLTPGSGFPVHVLSRGANCSLVQDRDIYLPLPAIAFRP